MTTVEWCPTCENDVEIDTDKPSHCPACESIILPCSACSCIETGTCIQTDEQRAYGGCSRFSEDDLYAVDFDALEEEN